MSICRHIPEPPLRQYIDWFCYSVDYYPEHDRQHVLPDGSFEPLKQYPVRTRTYEILTTWGIGVRKPVMEEAIQAKGTKP